MAGGGFKYFLLLNVFVATAESRGFFVAAIKMLAIAKLLSGFSIRFQMLYRLNF